MASPGFSAPEPPAGIDSHIASLRAHRAVLRNSRVLCWVTMLGAVVAGCMGVCFAIAFVVSLFPLKQLLHGGLSTAFWCAVATLAFLAAGPKFWSVGRDMQGYRVALDERGVDFNLGTKKQPLAVFMEWDQILAVKRRRLGNVQQIRVEGMDGSEVRFTSYTFFRPKKIARLIAERAGLPLQNA